MLKRSKEKYPQLGLKKKKKPLYVEFTLQELYFCMDHFAVLHKSLVIERALTLWGVNFDLLTILYGSTVMLKHIFNCLLTDISFFLMFPKQKHKLKNVYLFIKKHI